MLHSIVPKLNFHNLLQNNKENLTKISNSSIFKEKEQNNRATHQSSVGDSSTWLVARPSREGKWDDSTGNLHTDRWTSLYAYSLKCTSLCASFWLSIWNARQVNKSVRMSEQYQRQQTKKVLKCEESKNKNINYLIFSWKKRKDREKWKWKFDTAK